VLVIFLRGTTEFCEELPSVPPKGTAVEIDGKRFVTGDATIVLTLTGQQKTHYRVPLRALLARVVRRQVPVDQMLARSNQARPSRPQG
jgi:hypothetical protein